MKVLLKLYPRLNLGDDLFLKIICERYPNVNFFLLANNDYIHFNQWDNLTIYSTNQKESVFTKIKRVIKRRFLPALFEGELQKYMLKQNKVIFEKIDCFVSIGGSIFIQNTQDVRLNNEIAYYNLINKELGAIPKFFIGCNFGPYQSNQFYLRYKEIFQKSTDICFREKYSFDLFKDLKNVRLAPDVVFGMKIGNMKKRANTVGFSIVSARNGIDEAVYYQKYAQLIEAYQDKGFEIYLFSFCKEEGDEHAIEEIIQLMKSKKGLEKVFYDGNIEEFLMQYASMEYMFCGRFHAMILSMLYAQKIYPIVYSKKMTNVLSDIDYQGDYIDIQKIGELEISRILEQIESNTYDINQQKINSQLQFSALDVFLNV